MIDRLSRRVFFKGSAVAALLGLPAKMTFGSQEPPLERPIVISSANGLRAIERTYKLINTDRVDTLEAVVAGVNINEDDPEDNSVGYGGLPNENGVVELDASVMHGPSRRSGAVAALREIKNPSRLAYLVMQRTDHALLVGEGALRFAEAHGFNRENLLTEKSRLAWLSWKEAMSDRDSWGPGLSAPDEQPEKKTEGRIRNFLEEMGRRDLEQWVLSVIKSPPQGTISCLAVNGQGDLSGATTTSGLAWKLSGRVGDSPIIGSGLFVDNDVGGAGSTGRGEEAIKIAGAHTVVETMRRGASPRDAAMEAVKRVARNYGSDKKKLSQFNITFYALNKRGEYGAAALWNGAWRIDQFRRSEYAVCDSKGPRVEAADYLLARDSR